MEGLSVGLLVVDARGRGDCCNSTGSMSSNDSVCRFESCLAQNKLYPVSDNSDRKLLGNSLEILNNKSSQ